MVLHNKFHKTDHLEVLAKLQKMLHDVHFYDERHTACFEKNEVKETEAFTAKLYEIGFVIQVKEKP